MAEALAAYLIEAGASALVANVVAYAVVITASVVVSKALASQTIGGSFGDLNQQLNPGSRQQIPPAGDNKLPVIYGSAWAGGIITDLSITSDNQTLYFVLALSEVTNSENDNTPDEISFGDVYYGGKKCIFDETDLTKVVALLDESTGIQDTSVNGYLYIYLYSNGSYYPYNSEQTAISVMQDSNLAYQWDNTKLMSNCAFAIVKLNYNSTANITSLQQTKFNVINARTNVGDCVQDYLTSERYGAGIPLQQIDTTSIAALNTYSNELITYINNIGVPATQPRFKFDGAIDTTINIMNNLQLMASSADFLIRYNEITAKWGVIVQTPDAVPVMDLNDSNMVSSISVSPIDTSNSFNVIECKYPDGSQKDSFNSVTYDLAQLYPALLYPNEPINKQSLSLYFVNNDVRVQLLANRFLKAAREDLQILCKINYSGIQLEAGDIVTVTNANYGWTAKPFRVIKVTEEFEANGNVTASLNLTEYNSTVYDDSDITEFEPAPNTGIGDPTFFGTLYAPVISTQYPTIANPLFLVSVTTSSSGITQYAEVWYSAFSNPTPEQLIFAGTSEIQSSGNPWPVNYSLPAISLSAIPAGNWYFFTRMVNSLASSPFSAASSLFRWRPSTFQYTDKYLSIAYADDINGGGFSLSPTNKTYFGLFNQTSTVVPTNPNLYTWYLADPSFGTNKFVCYSNRTGRKFSFDTGFAAYAGGTAAFVPTSAIEFDPSIWSALPDGINSIDLDERTGQLIETGTTSVGTGEIAITNNPDGKVVASLKQYLDFGTGVYQKTSAVANLTVDIYGRVVGFEEPDAFYFTKQSFTATSGQTVFTVTRSSGYISGQCLVFQNGCLLDEDEYTDTSGSTGTVTLDVGATLNDVITIISVKSSNSSTGVYASFTRNSVTLTNSSSYTASGFTLNSGYELLFINGTILNEQDYDIIGQEITNFPSNITGDLQVIQWSPNNLGTPNGNPVNIVAYTIIGQTTYPFSYDVNAFDLYNNGVLQLQGTDYTTATGTYSLAVAPTSTSNILVQQTFARTGAV